MWFSAPLIVFYNMAILHLAAQPHREPAPDVDGIPPTKEFDHGFNQEELAIRADEFAPRPSLGRPGEQDHAKALRLKETRRSRSCSARTVVVLWRDLPLAENMVIAQKSGYSRCLLRRHAGPGAGRDPT